MYAIETELGTFVTDREDIAARLTAALASPAVRETELLEAVFTPWREED
jgi:hypothetical protein